MMTSDSMMRCASLLLYMMYSSGDAENLGNQGNGEPNSYIIQRLNMGALFLPYSTLIMSEDHWFTLFQLDLLQRLDPTPSYAACDELKFIKSQSRCMSLSLRLKQIHELRADLVDQFQQIVVETSKFTRYNSTRQKRQVVNKMDDGQPLLDQNNIEKMTVTDKETYTSTLFDQLTELTDPVIDEITETYEFITEQLDLDQDPTPHRRKRNVINSLLYHVFGIARRSDVDKIRHVVTQIQRDKIQMGTQLIQFQKETVSTMTIMNKRLDSVATATDALTFELTRLRQQIGIIQADLEYLAKSLNTFTSALVIEIRYVRQLQNTLRDYRQGIFDLASGRLSPYLVAHDQMQDALDQLTDTIRLAHPRARLVEPRSEYYYKYSSRLYAKVNNTLYISVSVPISVVPFPFKIYQIQITPLQI